MSDFRCEWQALHGPRCSHQCNECKDNDTPPEPRMTSERLETPDFKQADELARSAEAWAEDGSYNATMALARAYLTLRATPRAVPDETREAVANAVLEAETKWRDKLAADAHQSVRTLGERLTELLDDDHWNNVEPLLLAVAAALAAHPPRAGEATEDMVIRVLRDELGKPGLPDDMLLRQFAEEARWIRLTTAALGRPS